MSAGAASVVVHVGVAMMAVKATIIVVSVVYTLYRAARLKSAKCDNTTRGVQVPRNAFRGRVIWITGASSGIGEAVALKLASLGAQLVITARSKDGLERVGARVSAAAGLAPMILPANLDVTAAHSILAEQIVERFGSLDGVVLNHGIGYNVPVEDIDMELVQRLFSVNVISNISLAKTCIPHLRRSRGCTRNGRALIAVTGSASAYLPSPLASVYGATKHAIKGFFETIRMEVHKEIDIVIVAPGPVKSGFQTRHAQYAEGARPPAVEKYRSYLTVDEVAEMYAGAAYGGFLHVWLATHPYLFYMYLRVYLPDLFSWAVPYFARKNLARNLALYHTNTNTEKVNGIE